MFPRSSTYLIVIAVLITAIPSSRLTAQNSTNQKLPIIGYIDLTGPESMRSRDLESINKILWKELAQSEEFGIYARDDVFDFLVQKEIVSKTTAPSTLKPALISKALNCDYLVYGKINSKNGLYHLALYASNKGSDRAEIILKRKYVRIYDLKQDLPEHAKTLLNGLTDKPQKKSSNSKTKTEKKTTVVSQEEVAAPPTKQTVKNHQQEIKELQEDISKVDPRTLDSSAEQDIMNRLNNLDARSKQMWKGLVEHKRILEENRDAIIALQKEIKTQSVKKEKKVEAKVPEKSEPPKKTETKTPEKNKTKEVVPVVNNNSEVSQAIEKTETKTPETTEKITTEKSEKVGQEKQEIADKKKALEAARALIESAGSLDTGDPKRLEMYEKAAQMAPEDEDIQGYYLYEVCTGGEFKRAIQEGREMLKKFPQGDFLYLIVGYAEFNLNDYEAAKNDFQKSVELEPKSMMAQYYLGRTLAELKSPKAKKQLEDFILKVSEPSISSDFAEYIKEAKATLKRLEESSE